MENQNNVDLKYNRYFKIDYRSNPSGIGTVVYPSGDSILITDSSFGPKDMEAAVSEIKEEYLPSSVNHIPFDMGVYWKEGQGALEAILKTHDVQYVIDSELAYENTDLVQDLNQWLFTLENWIKCRSL